MQKLKQLYRHKPEIGQYGDCHRTAIACLLDIPVEDSPHFIGEYEARRLADPEDPYCWQAEQEDWLRSRGYTTVDCCYDGTVPIADVFAFMEVRNPGVLYLLGGMSPRGTNHTVICRGGDFYWDTHPDGGFLIGPMDNGMWEMSFILPASMKYF